MRILKSKRGDSQDNFLLEIGKLILGMSLVLIILGVIGKIAYSIFFSDPQDDSTINSYNVLLEGIRGIKDGETRQIPVYTSRSAGNNYMIIGFAEMQKTTQGACSAADVGKQIILTSPVEKDTRVCGDNGCLCLYEFIIADASYTVEELIRCERVKTSIKPGSFTIRFGDAWIKNLWGHIQDSTTDHSEKTTTVTCDFAAVPPFGGVGTAEITRVDDTVYLCWGSDCKP